MVAHNLNPSTQETKAGDSEARLTHAAQREDCIKFTRAFHCKCVRTMLKWKRIKSFSEAPEREFSS